LERESKFLLIVSICIVSICGVVSLQFFAFNNFIDNLSAFANDFSANQILLFFLSPLALYVLYKADHEKTSYLDLQKIFSYLFIAILISMIFVTPFSASNYYWPAVFAESNSTDSTVEPLPSELTTSDDSNSTESIDSSSIHQTNSTGDPPFPVPASTEDGNTSVESTTSSDTNVTSTEVTNSTSAEVTNSTSAEVTNSTSAEVTNSTSAEVTNATSPEPADSTSTETAESPCIEYGDSAYTESTKPTFTEVTNTTSQDVTNSISPDVTNTTSKDVTNTCYRSYRLSPVLILFLVQTSHMSDILIR